MSTDSRVDAYIASLPDWQRELCTDVRRLIHDAEPEIVEEIKFRNRPYFTLQGNVCALLTAKDHVNIFIYDPIAPDPEGLINQGQGNSTARAIQIYQNQELNSTAFIALIRAVATNNRQGGWRKIKST